MGPKSTTFSSMISRVANVMCVTKTRFQVSICVGPIRDQTYEKLHHYMVMAGSTAGEDWIVVLADLTAGEDQIVVLAGSTVV
jgi:hypothetical protein